MNRIFQILSFLILILLGCYKQNEMNHNPPEFKELGKSEIIALKLKKAYPEFIKRIDRNFLVWNDSVTMKIDDGISNKSFDSLLNYADIEDQFYYEYPNDSDYLEKLVQNYDPGRMRNEVFFKKMYGNTKEEVKENLAEIIWMPNSDGTKLYVTKINDVNEKIQSISNELDSLSDELKKYVINPAGTFYWREIAGTNRLSTHSFGIAIDINVKCSNYWKWQVDAGKKFEYKNRIPLEIVEIFEKHGFIWGGKWYHYDTMHFEYRPELIN